MKFKAYLGQQGFVPQIDHGQLEMTVGLVLTGLTKDEVAVVLSKVSNLGEIEIEL